MMASEKPQNIMSQNCCLNDKITVGVSTSSIEPSRNNGIVDGMGHYTDQLIRQLKSEAYNVKGYAFPRFMQKEDFKQSISLKLPFTAHALMSILTAGKLYNLNPSVDIFHSTDFKIVPMKCPVVATIWDAIPMVHPEWFPGSLRQRMAPWIFKGVSKFADRIIAVSEYAAKDISHYFGVPEARIDVIPWAVDDQWFEPIGNDFIDDTLKKYSLKSGYVLSVGTLQPRKNYDRLIDAYMRLPKRIIENHNLVIVGKYGWNSENLIKKINRFSPKGNVTWLPSVNSDEELRAIYRRAKVFAFPSLYEGFGVPVLEAFASNVPVVTSNTTSIPEVSNGAAIEIDPYSIDEICDAIYGLLSDDDARSQLITKGSKRVEQLRWKNTLAKTVEIYQKLI